MLIEKSTYITSKTQEQSKLRIRNDSGVYCVNRLCEELRKQLWLSTNSLKEQLYGDIMSVETITNCLYLRPKWTTENEWRKITLTEKAVVISLGKKLHRTKSSSKWDISRLNYEHIDKIKINDTLVKSRNYKRTSRKLINLEKLREWRREWPETKETQSQWSETHSHERMTSLICFSYIKLLFFFFCINSLLTLQQKFLMDKSSLLGLFDYRQNVFHLCTYFPKHQAT